MAKETVIIYRCDIKGCNSSVNTQDAPGNLNYWYEFKVEIGVTTAGSTAGSDELGTHEMTWRGLSDFCQIADRYFLRYMRFLLLDKKYSIILAQFVSMLNTVLLSAPRDPTLLPSAVTGFEGRRSAWVHPALRCRISASDRAGGASTNGAFR
jgi:hypothetical protein